MGFTGLHAIAFFGIGEILAAVLEMKKWDVNAMYCIGNTALTWAAGKGHDGVVKILLEREGVNPNHADTQYGQAPISLAAGNGHVGVVKKLLE